MNYRNETKWRMIPPAVNKMLIKKTKTKKKMKYIEQAPEDKG